MCTDVTNTATTISETHRPVGWTFTVESATRSGTSVENSLFLQNAACLII